MEISRFFGWLRRALAHRYLAVALVFLAVLIYLPTLGSGWWADDLVHRARLLGSLPLGGTGTIDPHPPTLPSALMDLFVWADPNKNIRPFMDFGSIPWWTFEGLRLSFWRPLAALTHWVDHRLWPDSAALMHVHSLLWFLAVIVLLTIVYRRLMAPAWVAGLAVLLFTLDDLHYGTVNWLASRYVLPSFIFGLLAILAHDRWRREGLWVQGLLSSLWLALALLSGEAGMGTLGYLVAYALFLDRGQWQKRVLSLVPSLAVVAAWRVIYMYLGYTASGTGLYVDPISQPLQFLSGIIERGPILLLGLLAEPGPARYAALSPTGSYYLWLFAVVFLTTVFFLLLPLFRRDPVARFWAGGMVLCIVPGSACTLPGGRLVLFAGLGAIGFVAQVIGGVLDRQNWVPIGQTRRASIWALTILFVGLHLVMPAWHGLKRVTKVSYVTSKSGWEPGPILPPNVEGYDVVIINHPNPSRLAWVRIYTTLFGHPLPSRIRVLAPGFSAVEMTRTDEVTLVVRSECGFLAPPDCSSKDEPGQFPIVSPIYRDRLFNRVVFRDGDHPLKLGELIELPGIRIEVTGLSKDNEAIEATFRFQQPLENTSMKWFKWDWQTKSFISSSPPPIGETIRVPGPFE